MAETAVWRENFPIMRRSSRSTSWNPDRTFVDVCRKFFPDNACGLEDPRVNIYYEDGLRFLRTKHDAYDLIINDAIDPLGHTAGLFTKGILMGTVTAH